MGASWESLWPSLYQFAHGAQAASCFISRESSCSGGRRGGWQGGCTWPSPDPWEPGAATRRSPWNRAQSPTGPYKSTGVLSRASKDQRHRQHTQSAHGLRAPEKSQRAQETWHFQDWTPQCGPGHTARTFSSSVQCSGTVSPYVPRRASDSLDTALHGLPPTAPGDRQQDEEMTVALCPPSPADSPTHFPCP